jgi:hypothetical protein
MEFAARLEIHFHDQERVSVILETTGGPDEKFGELTLFAAYACRQLSSLGRGETSIQLASLLDAAGSDLEALIGYRNQAGARLVDYAGAPGRKRFESRLRLTDEKYRFDMHAKGFGILGRGAGYYAPVSVSLLLQYLVERRLLDREFLGALALVTQNCARAFVTRELTIPSQSRVSLSAATLAAIQFKLLEREANGSIEKSADATWSEFDPGVTALLNQNGRAIAAEDWLKEHSSAASNLPFGSFNETLKLAFHRVVLEQSKIFSVRCPEAVPKDERVLHHDIGGYIMDGYTIGRRLLGTQSSDLAELSSAVEPKEFVEGLLSDMALMPANLLFAGGDGVATYLKIFIGTRSKMGIYARVKDRERVSRFLIFTILNGFALAVAEHRAIRG